MTNRRRLFTINLVKKGSREEELALLQVPPGRLVSLAVVLEVSLVVGAHSLEEPSASAHLASGMGSVEVDSTRRTQTRFLSEYFQWLWSCDQTI